MTRTSLAAIILAIASGASPAVEGHPPTRQTRDVGGMSDLKAMLLKYVARCALDEGQSLTASPTPDAGHSPDPSPSPTFPGSIGLAPEWLSGKCGTDCQERVSSCLLALVNRTGKHVELSLTSAAPSLVARLGPNAQDAGFPHQEGAFFGNVWSGSAFSCRGSEARKGPQVKRFCALEPTSCTSELATFVDAGPCSDACQMRCFAIGGDQQRCSAVACRDPAGRVWQHPITIFLRNQIEAANADRLEGVTPTDVGIHPLTANARATFERVDFGTEPRAARAARADRALVLALEGAAPGARVEVWLGNERKLGVGTIPPGPKVGLQLLRIPFPAAGIVGPHPIVLRLAGGAALGDLHHIELQ